MIRYTLPHTSTDAYALIYKCFTHFGWCFGWCFCGRILGGDCGKVCRISVFLHNQGNSKVFTLFVPSIGVKVTLFLPNIGVEITFFLPNVRGCGGVSFDEGVGEMGGVSGGNGFFRCFVVVKIGCE